MDLQSLKIDRKPAPVRARRRRWPAGLVVVAAAAGVGWLFAPQLQAFVDRVRLPAVRTFVVSDAPAAAVAAVRGTAANGYIVAARRAALSSDVPGRIVELNVREGSVVRKGDVVARLYADEYREALQRAEAELRAGQLQVARAEAAVAAAGGEVADAEARAATTAAQQQEADAVLAWHEAELRRTSELLASGSGSPRDVDRARSDRDAAAARTAAARAAVAAAATTVAAARQRQAVAQADVAVATAQALAAVAARDLARATLEKTDVRAPFDGVVVLKDAEVGEVVSPNVTGGSTSRGAVCTLVDFDSLEVQANVPETALPSVRLGAPADVFLDAFPEERYPGTVERIWPTADRAKATVEVRVRLLRKDERLRPEMGVRIVFRDGDEATATAPAAKAQLVVPEEAIVQIDGRAGVFVLERDVVRFQPVATGERRNGRVVVTDGLAADQRLVLSPPPTLSSGHRVRRLDS
jgi:RND family efflux transporter MFP subunit